ncbi:MAG TPA: NTP transferase domain-containing protein, partial [Candidatus Polarisedimenticolia bacterium]|nr:NTP transferase domain-containing protein [Candidatus Polarisedimenticolia bacterium]
MIITALIVAAGRGTRMRAPGPKALLPLGGATLLSRAI